MSPLERVSPEPRPGRVGPELTVRLDYRLEDLPSAQHRAGLAGLVLLARWLARPDGLGLAALTPEGATLDLTRAGLELLFDEVYGVLPGPKEPVVPRAAFVASLEPGGAAPGPWTQLWRDWLWTIHRGAPKAREPFEARAEGRPARDVAAVWQELSQGGRAGGGLDAGTLLGSFALNLDRVPVRDTAAHRLLLHFWPCAIMVYLLRRNRSWGGKPDLDGFVAAIPDILDLEGFCQAYPAALRKRSAERAGPRPREALVDHPAEAALDFARRLERPSGPVRAQAYEAHHAKAQGRTMRVQAVLRVEPAPGLLAAYGDFRALGYLDPVFRRTGLQNLIDGQPWHRGFGEVFGPAGCARRTILAEPFRRDVRMAFRVAVRLRSDGSGPALRLESLIREAVTGYVLGEVWTRHQLGPEPSGASPGVSAAFEDRRRSVATQAFLALRERPDPAFAAFFKGPLLARTQEPQEARRLLDALARDPGQVRTLTLLALAAVA